MDPVVLSAAVPLLSVFGFLRLWRLAVEVIGL